MRRLLLASWVLLLTAGCLGAATGRALNSASLAPPSRLDYLLLASLADAQRPLAMAAYRPEPSHDPQ